MGRNIFNTSMNYVQTDCVGRGYALKTEGPGFKSLLSHSILCGRGQVINLSVPQNLLICKIGITLHTSKGCCVDILESSVKVGI